MKKAINSNRKKTHSFNVPSFFVFSSLKIGLISFIFAEKKNSMNKKLAVIAISILGEVLFTQSVFSFIKKYKRKENVKEKKEETSEKDSYSEDNTSYPESDSFEGESINSLDAYRNVGETPSTFMWEHYLPLRDFMEKYGDMYLQKDINYDGSPYIKEIWFSNGLCNVDQIDRSEKKVVFPSKDVVNLTAEEIRRDIDLLAIKHYSGGYILYYEAQSVKL